MYRFIIRYGLLGMRKVYMWFRYLFVPYYLDSSIYDRYSSEFIYYIAYRRSTEVMYREYFVYYWFLLSGWGNA